MPRHQSLNERAVVNFYLDEETSGVVRRKALEQHLSVKRYLNDLIVKTMRDDREPVDVPPGVDP